MYFQFFPHLIIVIHFTCLVTKLCPTPCDPHGLQHARLLCRPLSPGVCSDSRPLTQWYYLTISSSAVLFLLPSIFPSIRVFSNESALCIRWPTYGTFMPGTGPASSRLTLDLGPQAPQLPTLEPDSDHLWASTSPGTTWGLWQLLCKAGPGSPPSTSQFTHNSQPVTRGATQSSRGRPRAHSSGDQRGERCWDAQEVSCERPLLQDREM